MGPGGEPTKRPHRVFLHVLSDISIRTSVFVAKHVSANVLANSVFPTPVGPRNKNEPIDVLIFQSVTSTANRTSNRWDSFFFVQSRVGAIFFKMNETFAFFFLHLF